MRTHHRRHRFGLGSERTHPFSSPPPPFTLATNPPPLPISNPLFFSSLPLVSLYYVWHTHISHRKMEQLRKTFCKLLCSMLWNFLASPPLDSAVSQSLHPPVSTRHVYESLPLFSTPYFFFLFPCQMYTAAPKKQVGRVALPTFVRRRKGGIRNLSRFR